jgi:hypothetical protein
VGAAPPKGPPSLHRCRVSLKWWKSKSPKGRFGGEGNRKIAKTLGMTKGTLARILKVQQSRTFPEEILKARTRPPEVSSPKMEGW